MSQKDKKTYFGALVVALMVAIVSTVSLGSATPGEDVIDLPPLLPAECNDNDVDGFVVSEQDMPADWDGIMSPTCHDIIGWGDCNDYDAGIFPSAVDIAGDGADQNCDDMDGVDINVEIKVYPIEEPPVEEPPIE